jgi:hypothetical protein
MRGEKVVELGVTFRFPTGKGEYGEASTVTVRAPGLANFRVHNKMQAYVMDGAFAMMKKAVEARGGVAAAAAAEAAAEAEREANGETLEEAPEPLGVDTMNQMSIGLGVERFPEFCEFIRKSLTNSKFATIGDSKIMITDETWEAIEEVAGMDGVMEVMGQFVGFFAGSQKSRKPSGSEQETISSWPTKAPSAPAGLKKPRLAN